MNVRDADVETTAGLPITALSAERKYGYAEHKAQSKSM